MPWVGSFFVQTMLLGRCASFNVLQSKHLWSDPEASRLVIGPSGVQLLLLLGGDDLPWPCDWLMASTCDPGNVICYCHCLTPPQGRLLSGSHWWKVTAVKADWLLWFFAALWQWLPLGVRTKQLNMLMSAHTHLMTHNLNTHKATLAWGHVLHNLPHTHTFKQGQELKVIVNQRDMRKRWWVVW